MVLQKGYPERKRGFTQQAFKLRLQSDLKSPQTSIKLLSPKGSSFACRTENLMPRLFFLKMLPPKAHFNSRGVSGSKPLPRHWFMPLWRASEFWSSLSTITAAAAVTKASAGEDVFFGQHMFIFWGRLPSLFLRGESWDLRLLTSPLSPDARRSATPACRCPCWTSWICTKSFKMPQKELGLWGFEMCSGVLLSSAPTCPLYLYAALFQAEAGSCKAQDKQPF